MGGPGSERRLQRRNRWGSLKGYAPTGNSFFLLRPGAAVTYSVNWVTGIRALAGEPSACWDVGSFGSPFCLALRFAPSCEPGEVGALLYGQRGRKHCRHPATRDAVEYR
jgi:hypothetical protein